MFSQSPNMLKETTLKLRLTQKVYASCSVTHSCRKCKCVVPPVSPTYMTFICAEAKITGNIYHNVPENFTFPHFEEKFDIF